MARRQTCNLLTMSSKLLRKPVCIEVEIWMFEAANLYIAAAMLKDIQDDVDEVASETEINLVGYLDRLEQSDTKAKIIGKLDPAI